MDPDKTIATLKQAMNDAEVIITEQYSLIQKLQNEITNLYILQSDYKNKINRLEKDIKKMNEKKSYGF